MKTNERYDKIINDIESVAVYRPHDYLEVIPNPDELSQKLFAEAEYPGVDRKGISSIFNFMVGMTFKQYLDKRIMMYAYKVLLEQDQYDADVLKNITGVSSDSALYKKFESTFELSPKEVYEQKDYSLYVGPAYWDTFSDKKHEEYEAKLAEIIRENERLKESEQKAREDAILASQNAEEARISEAQARESEAYARYSEQIARRSERKSKLAYKEFRIGLLLLIAIIAISISCLLKSGWAGEYVVFNNTVEDGLTRSQFDGSISYVIKPLKNQVEIVSSAGDSRTIKKVKFKKGNISWVDPNNGLTYIGQIFSDKSIVCYEIENDELASTQIRLIKSSDYEQMKEYWDGYYEVFIDNDNYMTPNGYSVQIRLDESLFILGEILGEDVQVAWIAYCGPDHIVFTLPSLPDTVLQGNLTGKDTFTVSELNSSDMLFKCFKVIK